MLNRQDIFLFFLPQERSGCKLSKSQLSDSWVWRGLDVMPTGAAEVAHRTAPLPPGPLGFTGSRPLSHGLVLQPSDHDHGAKYPPESQQLSVVSEALDVFPINCPLLEQQDGLGCLQPRRLLDERAPFVRLLGSFTKIALVKLCPERLARDTSALEMITDSDGPHKGGSELNTRF